MRSPAGEAARWLSVVVGVVIVLGASASRTGQGVESAQRDMPECPHAWSFDTARPATLRPGEPWVVSGLRNTATGTETSLAGPITNVPEFHDCQRLIERDNRYGTMAAVFASYRLEASEYSSKELPSVKEALAFVEVYSERPYGPLGIQKGFNCLFLYNDGGPQGRMVPVGADEAKCTRRFDGNLDIGVRLEVRTSPLGHPALTAVDIPPVARWDRDVQNGNNYIGVKCGESWCEIGAPKFNSSAKIQLSEGAAFSNEFMRSMLIKGWYDQQALAVYSGGVLSNSRVIGTVFPFSHLERYSIGVGDPNFGLDGQWRPAAHVFVPAEMKDYVSKLNLSRADLPTVVANNTQPSLNLIEMCHGTREECAVPSNQAQRCENRLKRSGVVPSWWARITAAGKGTPRIRHFCIMYRGHPDIPRIPGTVRWRWSATDEVIWIRCPAGCCEVEEDT